MAPSLRIRLKILGGHTPDDIVAHVLPSRDGAGIVQFVDLINPGFAPFFRFGVTEDFARYIEVHDELLKLDFKTSSLDMPDWVLQTHCREQAVRLERDQAAQTASKKVTNADLVAAGAALVNKPGALQFGNGYWAFELQQRLHIAVCFRALVEQWGCKLAAVDVVGESLCDSALIFNLVDG